MAALIRAVVLRCVICFSIRGAAGFLHTPIGPECMRLGALGSMTETFAAVRYGGRAVEDSHVARMQALAGVRRKALRRAPRSRA
jgi:hypothetical protein